MDRIMHTVQTKRKESTTQKILWVGRFQPKPVERTHTMRKQGKIFAYNIVNLEEQHNQKSRDEVVEST